MTGYGILELSKISAGFFKRENPSIRMFAEIHHRRHPVLDAFR